MVTLFEHYEPEDEKPDPDPPKKKPLKKVPGLKLPEKWDVPLLTYPPALHADAIQTTYSHKVFPGPPPTTVANNKFSPPVMPQMQYCRMTLEWTDPDGTTHSMVAPKVAVAPMMDQELYGPAKLGFEVQVLHAPGSPGVEYQVAPPPSPDGDPDPLEGLAAWLLAQEDPGNTWSNCPKTLKEQYRGRILAFLSDPALDDIPPHEPKKGKTATQVGYSLNLGSLEPGEVVVTGKWLKADEDGTLSPVPSPKDFEIADTEIQGQWIDKVSFGPSGGFLGPSMPEFKP